MTDEMSDEYKIRMNNTSNETYHASLITYNPEFLDVKVDERDIKPGKDRYITVKLVDPDRHGPAGFQRSFTIELSNTEKTRFTIPVQLSNHKTKMITAGQNASYKKTNVNQPVRPSGLQTKTGNNIDIIKAGTKETSKSKKN